MYLYFDESGTLKEIINDVPLRQGSSNWNKIYVYWAGEVNNETEILRLMFQFVLPNNSVYPNLTAEIQAEIVNQEIPYDNSRDLTFFEYYTTYRMFKIDVPDLVLQQAGTITLSTRVFENDTAVLSMDAVPFYVDETSIGSIAPNEYLNLAQYNELLKILAGKLDKYTRTVIVDTLPEEGVLNVLYFVKGSITGDPYQVWVWYRLNNDPDQSGSWELLGEVSGDFASKEEQAQFEADLINQWDNFRNSLQQQANSFEQQIENDIEQIRATATSGGPKGVYNTLSDLQNANPDHNYFYLVKNNMHIYYWDGAWVDAGPYSAPSTVQVNNRTIFLNDTSVVLEDERLIVLEL